MPYDPTNNPYIPGDPYSYDLRWMVDKIQEWTDPIDSAERAEAAEAAAKASEQQSEAWAVGTIDGDPVSADDPQYENNAKYYADQAEVSANDANTLVSPINSRMNVIEGRMDTFTHLPAASTAGDAELIDIRVGVNGYTWPAAGDAVRGQINKIQNGTDDFMNRVTNSKYINVVNFSKLNFTGYINGNDGTFTPGISLGGLDCSTDFIPAESPVFMIQNSSTMYFNVVQYDASQQFIRNNLFTGITDTVINMDANCKYIRLSFKSNEAGFGQAQTCWSECSYNVLYQKAIWRNGSVANVLNANAVANTFIIPNLGATSITFYVEKPLPAGHKYRYQLTTYSITGARTRDASSYRITRENTIVSSSQIITYNITDGSVGFALALYELDENDSYVPLRVETMDTSLINIIRKYEESDVYEDVIISADFTRHPIKLDMQISISGAQAFCMYGGKFYSTNGSNLYEQSSTGSVISTTALNLGHGNSLQIGHDRFAYASGWNDNKIYVVDLSSKTITDTINLPTTGYTTAAIDDINHIAYIFQRNTSPGSGNEYYNFIVYDYNAGNILSSKKTTVAFGAMQACDFIDGKIFVLNGLGTSAIPNGYRIFSTSGEILAEYILPSFATNEPEGVFVDRSTKEVYISFVNQKLYKVTPF